MNQIQKKQLKMQYLGPFSLKQYFIFIFAKTDNYLIYKFLYHLRTYEDLIAQNSGLLLKARRFFHYFRYQKYARMVGFVIGDGVLGKNVIFYHRASIIINSQARVGDGCRFHGDAVLGVKNTGSQGCPVLGKNVDIGAGAKILGDIYIADDIVIGANSVVVKSFHTPGITIAGIPAREIHSNKLSNH